MKILQRDEQVMPWVGGPRVLDVGCTGHVPSTDDPHWLHGALCKRFPDTVGIDVRPDLIAELQELGFRNLYLANAETFDLDRQFDTIVAAELIEHLSNPGAFLDRVRKHLAPGGRIVITTPNPFSLVSLLYTLLKYPRTCWNVEHTCWFCPQTFTELCRRAGLKVVDWKLVGTYTLDSPSFRYRAFVRMLALFGGLLPERLKCNTMLFVVAPGDKVDALPYRLDVMSSSNPRTPNETCQLV